jgi:hypothetical protein
MYGNGLIHMLKVCLLEEMRQRRLQSLYEVILRKRIIHAMVEPPITKESGNRHYHDLTDRWERGCLYLLFSPITVTYFQIDHSHSQCDQSFLFTTRDVYINDALLSSLKTPKSSHVLFYDEFVTIWYSSLNAHLILPTVTKRLFLS